MSGGHNHHVPLMDAAEGAHNSSAQELETHGFATLPVRVSEPALRSYRAALARAPFAVRDLLHEIPETRAFLSSIPDLVEVVAPKMRVVRSMLFDKAPRANWSVPWHQDLFVAVEERHDVEGFDAWTSKKGVVHARAPRTLLQRMLALRIHLDDCSERHGPLHVAPGSHKTGVLAGQQVCCFEAGQIFLMRPLLLHSSPKAETPSQRRVVHLELADFDLPLPLRWKWSDRLK